MTNKKTIIIIRNAIFIIMAAIALWAYGLTAFVKEVPTEATDTSEVTDGIVILTGGSNRLDSAIKLLNEQKAKKLLISGVGKEANLASVLILSGSLPNNIAHIVDRIELGYEAQDTIGNATEAEKWVKENGYKSIRLVTANYHIKRSMVEFKKAMPDIKIIPSPVQPNELFIDNWWRHGATKKTLFIEYNKYLISKILELF